MSSDFNPSDKNAREKLINDMKERFKIPISEGINTERNRAKRKRRKANGK